MTYDIVGTSSSIKGNEMPILTEIEMSACKLKILFHFRSKYLLMYRTCFVSKYLACMLYQDLFEHSFRLVKITIE